LKKAITSLILLLIVIWAFDSGTWEHFAKFMIWLFTLNETQSSVSIIGEIFVKIATFGITYSLVGFIFNSLGFFNSGIMKFAYFVISTLLSFGLCYVVVLIEKHILTIAIVLLVLLITSLMGWFVWKRCYNE